MSKVGGEGERGGRGGGGVTQIALSHYLGVVKMGGGDLLTVERTCFQNKIRK